MVGPASPRPRGADWRVSRFGAGISGTRPVAARRYREDMGEPPLIRIGHPPRGRRAVPFGWPERLTAIALGFLLLLLIWGLS
jgi:hypothetical protein